MSRPLAFTLALYLAVCALAPAAQKTQRIELYYGIAEGNYLIGDLKGAANGVEEMLKVDPDYLPALTLKTRIKLDQNDAPAALLAADRALALAPRNFEYQLLKALVLGNLDRRDEASALINQVIARADPASDDARAANQLRGLLHMADHDWDAAAQTFHRNYLADPESAASSLKLASEAYLEKARNALNQRKTDEAVAAIDQALALYAEQTGQEALRQSTSLRMMRARVLTQLGDFAAAIEDLQVLTGQQPDNLEALVTLASLYASTERWESLTGLIAPLAEQPQLKDIALYLEGRTALAKGRAGTARAKFEAALELLPDGPSRLRASLHFYRGLCLEKLERTAEAETEILTALDADFRPETAEEALHASRVLLRAKQPARAIPILEAITLNQIDPSAQAWALLGRAHQAVNATALALSAFNQSLSIDPAQGETRALRGALLRQLGDLDGAAADTQSALLLHPDNSALTYTLGLIRFQQGDLRSAEQHIGLAAQHEPANPGIHLLHALLAYNIDAPETARRALDIYLALASETPNESAIYLEYALTAANDPQSALAHLNQRAAATHSSAFLKSHLAYCQGTLDRKTILDAAGKAKTSKNAQSQLCETAYWLAQHERHTGNPEAASKLLKIATEIGNADIPEHQFAKWQLR